MKFFHLDYNIDKKRYRDIFWKNYRDGRWHTFDPPKMIWWKLFLMHCDGGQTLVEDVEKDLNILGLNTFPRFSYQFPHTTLQAHYDEDNMTGINLNLLEDSKPTIHLEGKPHEYESCVVHVGGIKHSVESDPNPRLILKFAIRHPWEEVILRLSEVNLIRKVEDVK